MSGMTESDVFFPSFLNQQFEKHLLFFFIWIVTPAGLYAVVTVILVSFYCSYWSFGS